MTKLPEWPYIPFYSDWGPTPMGCGWCNSSVASWLDRSQVQHRHDCPAVVMPKMQEQLLKSRAYLVDLEWIGRKEAVLIDGIANALGMSTQCFCHYERNRHDPTCPASVAAKRERK